MSLVDVTLRTTREPFLAIIAQVNKREDTIVHLSRGFYECAHWNFEMCVAERVNQYPAFGDLDEYLHAYGVCDSPTQFLARFGERLEADERRFVVAFVKIEKATEGPGGWRWHKWGPYVGEQEPQTEYLLHEPVIERVYTYHIYEVLP